MKIIITDLTRFRNPDLVCIAGATEDGTVVRPMPYLTSKLCRELDIHPGGILEGDFTFQQSAAPHVEDASFGRLTFHGACPEDDFRAALEATLYPSVSEGFGCTLGHNQKCIPIDDTPPRSLVTIKVIPSSFAVVQDRFDPTKVKAHFSDALGTELLFVAVTDRGFHDYAQQYADNSKKISEICRFINSQDELYLRLGLSRAYKAPDGRYGYWIQVNGIYTFPKYLEHIRCYG